MDERYRRPKLYTVSFVISGRRGRPATPKCFGTVSLDLKFATLLPLLRRLDGLPNLFPSTFT